MINIRLPLILVLTAVLVNQARNTRTDFLRELTREQQTEHSAIAWIGAGWLDYFVFRDKPGMHRYMLSGPHLWAASLYPPGDQLFGTIKSGTESAFAARHEGKVVWQNPSLITRQSPEVSPGGNMFVVEGRDLKTGSEGLLLVKDRGRTVVQIAHAGNNASWSSEDRRFVYAGGGYPYL